MRGGFVAVLLAAWACAPGRAQACAACGCGDQTLTAFGVEKPYRNRVRLSLEERYMDVRFGDNLDGALNRTLRTALSVGWTPERHVTVAAMLPWISGWLSPLKGGRTIPIEGLGDLETSVRALLWSDRSFNAKHLLWASAGLKMPTGPEALDERGYPLESDVQPGSGSWDPFVGATYGYFGGGLVSFFASASYRYPTTGRHGYQFGQSLGASAAAQVQPWWWGAFQAGFDFRWSAADQLANQHASPDTGGALLYFSPGIMLSPLRSGNLLVRATVSLPFLQELNGLQYVGPQTTLAISYDLN